MELENGNYYLGFRAWKLGMLGLELGVCDLGLSNFLRCIVGLRIGEGLFGPSALNPKP